MVTKARASKAKHDNQDPNSDVADRNGSGAADENRKEDILAATLKLAAEEGFDKISVRKVAALAGVSPSLITYHYQSIAKLIAEAWWLLHTRESRQRDETIGRVSGLKRIEEGYRLLMDGPSSGVTPQLRLDFWSKTARTPALRDLFIKQERRLRSSHIAGLEASISEGDLDPCLQEDLELVEDLIQAFHLGLHTWSSLHVKPKDRTRALAIARLFLARLTSPAHEDTD